MADIDLERKRSGGMGWLWALLLLLLLAALAWWFWPRDGIEEADVETAPVEEVEPVTEPATPEPAGLALAAILDNPEQYLGQTFPDTEVQVGEEMTDRGFWIEQDGRRLLAIIIDVPQEEPKDINPGQTLRITDGTLRGPSYLGEIPGVPLDADTESMASGQEIFLVVDERNIEILQEG